MSELVKMDMNFHSYFRNDVTAPNLSPLEKSGFLRIFLNPIVSKVSALGLEK